MIRFVRLGWVVFDNTSVESIYDVASIQNNGSELESCGLREPINGVISPLLSSL